MFKKTFIAGVSTLAVAGLLAGGAATGAQAATPTHQATAQVAPKPLYSKRFNFGNALGVANMVLADAHGDNEGLPAVGSVLQPGDFQGFEVQYEAGGEGIVYASYDLMNRTSGAWMGHVTIKMTYGCFGDTSTVIVGETNVHTQITGDGNGNPELTWK